MQMKEERIPKMDSSRKKKKGPTSNNMEMRNSGRYDR